MQLSFNTPFEKQSVVVDLTAFDNQAESAYIPKTLGKEYGKPVLFSNNLQEKLSASGEKDLCNALKTIINHQIAKAKQI